MERVSVVDRTTYTPLYDWCMGRWKDDAKQSKDAAALIQFFYQFARDVQGGNVIRVEFDRPAVDLGNKHRSQTFTRGSYGIQPWNPRGSMAIRKRPSNPLQLSPPLRSLPNNNGLLTGNGNSSAAVANNALSPTSSSTSASPPTKRIEMFCSDNDQIIVAIFLNTDYDKPGPAIATQLRDQFLSQFSSHFPLQLNGLDRSAIEEGGYNETFLPHFTSFREYIERSGILEVKPKASTATQPNSPLSPQASPFDPSPPFSSSLPQLHSRLNSPHRVPHTSLTNQNRVTVGSLPLDYSFHTIGSASDDYMPSWLLDTAHEPALATSAQSSLPTLQEKPSQQEEPSRNYSTSHLPASASQTPLLSSTSLSTALLTQNGTRHGPSTTSSSSTTNTSSRPSDSSMDYGAHAQISTPTATNGSSASVPTSLDQIQLNL